MDISVWPHEKHKLRKSRISGRLDPLLLKSSQWGMKGAERGTKQCRTRGVIETCLVESRL